MAKPIINQQLEEIRDAILGLPTSGVQEAVDEWLDEHPEATTTVDFSIVSKVYGTVADMIADTTVEKGDNVCTKGYYAEDDEGGANYVISATSSGVFYISLSNGLYANRLSEIGVLKAESIGIKAYQASTDSPVQDDMDTNVTLFNLATANNVRLLFGRGYYYFSSAIQLAHSGSYEIKGIGRDVTFLVFPNSDGLVFSEAVYYYYTLISGMEIDSYGSCIVVSENARTVRDCRFDWLYLNSETGNCFQGPTYNVSKFTSDETTIYDTCVQNCVFDFVNVCAPEGAGFANIMGMYSYYRHINIISCKYAFRNCDGNIEQLNMLGNYADYFIYYDKANSHTLKWMMVNVNAEGLTKAFIYTETEVSAPSGEDRSKPETANVMALSSLVAINSTWTLRDVSSGHDVYPITVHSIGNIFLINSDKIVVPSAYPSVYDTSVVKAHINATRTNTVSTYHGGPTITVIKGSNIQTYYREKATTYSLSSARIPYSTFYLNQVPMLDMIYVSKLFGGKALDAWVVNSSDIGTYNVNPSDEHKFCDVIAITVDTESTSKRISTFCVGDASRYPGRIITIVNEKASLNVLKLSANLNSNYALHTSVTSDIELAAGESVALMQVFDVHPTSGNILITWRPIFT